MLSLLAFALLGCYPEAPKPGIVMYSDVDRKIVDPLVRQFEQESKIPITVEYASPESKRDGMGLATRIRETGKKSGIDVYWADNPLSMLTLQSDGVLNFNNTQAIPETFRDRRMTWHALGARVRVLLLDTKQVSTARAPKSFATLTRPEWKGRVALAHPRISGSSYYHLLGVFTVLGADRGKEIVEQIKNNAVQLLPDEAAVIEAVRSGKAAWGVTDSDLAIAAVKANPHLKYVVPDQTTFSTGQALGRTRGVPTLGTPVIFSPIAHLTFTSHPRETRLFFQWLFSNKVSVRLAELQPQRIPTQTLLLGTPDQPVATKPLDFWTLKRLDIPPDQIPSTRTELNLALTVLGTPSS